MQTIESLKRKIQSAQDLLGVVKTMKALAAVSIRQYQKAVESLSEYNRTVEMGLQVVLKQQPGHVCPDAVVCGRNGWGPSSSEPTRDSAGSSTTSSPPMPSRR